MAARRSALPFAAPGIPIGFDSPHRREWARLDDRAALVSGERRMEGKGGVICLDDGPGPPAAVKRPSRFP
jgi:hypothetical protein